MSLAGSPSASAVGATTQAAAQREQNREAPHAAPSTAWGTIRSGPSNGP